MFFGWSVIYFISIAIVVLYGLSYFARKLNSTSAPDSKHNHYSSEDNRQTSYIKSTHKISLLQFKSSCEKSTDTTSSPLLFLSANVKTDTNDDKFVPVIPVLNIVTNSSSPNVMQIRPAFIYRTQPYYFSSGDNSGSENTVFPFHGILAAPKMIHVHIYKVSSGWFMKPDQYFKDDVIADFKRFGILEKIEPEILKILNRFGMYQHIGVSIAIGGGVWATPAGERFKDALLSVSELREKIELINPVKFGGVDKNIVLTNSLDSILAVNKWFLDNGAQLDPSTRINADNFKHDLKEWDELKQLRYNANDSKPTLNITSRVKVNA